MEDWDTLGQRATRSDTTRLHGAVVRPDRVVRRLPPGPNPDPLIFGVFVNFEILLASVYAGIATARSSWRRRRRSAGRR